MSNYYKSEIYRVLRDIRLYLVVAGCSALMIAMNLVLFFAGKAIPDFRYANTGFAFGMLSGSMNIAMVIALIFTSIVFADEFKNRTISNSNAFGLSTTKILFGKLFATITVALPSLIVVEAVLAISAYLLLEDSGIEEVYLLLRSNLACSFLFVGAVSIFLIFLFLLKNEVQAVWTWLGIVVLGSKVVDLLGMKFTFFAKLSNWLIYPLSTKALLDETTQKYYMIWDRAAGMTHVILVGVVTSVVALIVGVLVSRKRA